MAHHNDEGSKYNPGKSRHVTGAPCQVFILYASDDPNKTVRYVSRTAQPHNLYTRSARVTELSENGSKRCVAG